MKLENLKIIFFTLLLLAFAIIGIEEPLLSWCRPNFAITMNLVVVFGIIGYSVGYARTKRDKQIEKDLIKYLERYKKDSKQWKN